MSYPFPVSGNNTEGNDTDLQISPDDILFSNDHPLKGTPVTITAFFHNLLEIDPPSVLVRFYNGTPGDATFIGEQVVQIRGRSDFVAQVDWTPPVEGDLNITVFVDPDNEIPEANESNNIAAKVLHVYTKPDVRIRDSDIVFSDNNPHAGDNITIMAMARNIEAVPTGWFIIRFYRDQWQNLIGEYNMSLAGHETKVAQVPWIAMAGNHTIHAVADSTHVVDEMDETNNHGQKEIAVRWQPGGSPIFNKPTAIAVMTG